MEDLIVGFTNISIGQIVMLIIAGILIYLAIKKDYEPALLLPIGFGTILANIPMSSAIGEHGVLSILFNFGIANELFPLLIFIAIGAMTTFCFAKESIYAFIWCCCSVWYFLYNGISFIIWF